MNDPLMNEALFVPVAAQRFVLNYSFYRDHESDRELSEHSMEIYSLRHRRISEL